MLFRSGSGHKETSAAGQRPAALVSLRIEGRDRTKGKTRATHLRFWSKQSKSVFCPLALPFRRESSEANRGFLTKKIQPQRAPLVSPRPRIQRSESGPKSEEIPTIVQFSAKPETERWWEFLSWTKAAKSIFHISKQCHPLTGLPILIGGRTLFHGKKAVIVALI